MKNFIFLIILVLTFFVINNQTTNAQEKRLSSSPRIFQTFYSKFKSAVAKNDKKQVASMTLFPFKYAFDAGNEGAMSKAQFIKRFSDIFKSPKQFFTEKNPVFSRGDGNSYIISDDSATHLVFVKKGKSFKFTEYLAEP